jgi:glycosyltransferase involved in cell wall biosynthesis
MAVWFSDNFKEDNNIMEWFNRLLPGMEHHGWEMEKHIVTDDLWFDEWEEELPYEPDLVMLPHMIPTSFSMSLRNHNDDWQGFLESIEDIPTIGFFRKQPWTRWYKHLPEWDHVIDVAAATQHVIQENVRDLDFPSPHIRKPIQSSHIHDGDGAHEREDIVMSLSRMMKRKKVGMFIRQVPNINMRAIVHQKGPKRSEYKENGWWDEALDNGMEYEEWVSRDQLADELRTAKIVADIEHGDWPEATNYVPIEGMCYGCIPLMHETMVPPVFEGNVLTFEDEDDLPRVINETTDEELREYRERGWQCVRNNFTSERVAESILDVHQAILDDDLTQWDDGYDG